MTGEQPLCSDRRPIASRRLGVIQDVARWLTRIGIAPNTISVSSLLFGAGAGLCLAATSSTTAGARLAAGLGAAGFIQLRLLANLFDGMVAVEGGKGSVVGGIFNDAPDRVSDSIILIGAGYAVGGGPLLGCLAALGALFTAYVRVLGASCGAGQVFLGPMAKPQRMFVLTVTSLYLGVAPNNWLSITAGGRQVGLMCVVLAGVTVLCVVTGWRRLRRICAILTAGSRTA